MHGASRFLNKIYAQDVYIGGAAEFENIEVSGTYTGTGNITTNGSLYVGHSTAANAKIYLNNKLALDGHDGWLRVNEGKAFTNGVYFGANIVRVDNEYCVGGDNKIRLTTSSAIFNVPITGTQATINNLFVPNELRALKYNIQTIANLGGSFVVAPTLNCSSTATAQVTAVSGTTITMAIKDSSIDSANFAGATWSANSQIKIMGKLGGVVIGTCNGKLTAAMNNTAQTLNVQFTYTGQTTSALSVKTYAASEIEDLTVMLTTVGATNPVGIYMTSYDTNGYSHISLYGGTATAPTVRIGNLTGLAAVNGITPSGWGLYTDHGFFSGVIVSNSGKIGNFTISDALYTKKNTLGGVDSNKQNVYLGNDGISLGETFKVTNAGALTASSGTIGGWTIGESDLHNGTTSMASTDAGIYLGTTGIRNYKDANTYVNISEGVITAKGADLSGAITATDGKIGCLNIGTNILYTLNHSTFDANSKGLFINDNYLAFGPKAIVYFSKEGTGRIGDWRFSTNGALYSNQKVAYDTAKEGIYIGSDYISLGNGAVTYFTSAGTGKIGPWTLTTTALYNTQSEIDPEDGSGSGVYLGSDGIALGQGVFYVTAAGALHAESADITGIVTATGGKIGNWNISDGVLYYGTTSMTSPVNGIYLGTDGIRNYNYNSTTKTSRYVNIQDGQITANDANITGTIYATGGKIGNLYVDSSSIYTNGHSTWNAYGDGVYIDDSVIAFGSGGVTYFNDDGTGKIGSWTVSETAFYAYDPTDNTKGVYLGTDGITIGKGQFIVTPAGALYAENATLGGSLLTGSGDAITHTVNRNGVVVETMGDWDSEVACYLSSFGVASVDPTEDVTTSSAIYSRIIPLRFVDTSQNETYGWYVPGVFSVFNLYVNGNSGAEEVRSYKAVQEWVNDQGFLKNTWDTTYATQNWVDNQNYATQGWVNNKGYLKSVPSSYSTTSSLVAETTYSGISGITVRTRKKLGITTIYFASFNFPSGTSSSSTDYSLPSYACPTVYQDLVSVHNQVRFHITTDGYIQPASTTSSSTGIRGTFTFQSPSS